MVAGSRSSRQPPGTSVPSPRRGAESGDKPHVGTARVTLHKTLPISIIEDTNVSIFIGSRTITDSVGTYTHLSFYAQNSISSLILSVGTLKIASGSVMVRDEIGSDSWFWSPCNKRPWLRKISKVQTPTRCHLKMARHFLDLVLFEDLGQLK